MPFVAGASTDSGARVIAQVLETRWGVPVKVVNKPGGNTVPAVTEVMAARPDGTTMLVDNIASSAMLDTVVKNLPFKVSDRTFVAVTAYTPMMFIVHPDSPIKTLQARRPRRMKKETETFTWTSLGGVGAQDMVFRQFAAAAGVDVEQDAGGRAQGRCRGRDDDGRRSCAARHRHLERHCRPAQRRQAARAGGRRSRALAASADAPTTKEAGFPDVEVLFWIGISGPPGLPADIVATWDAALKEVLADKAVQDKMLNAGLVTSYHGCQGMAARVERDRKTHADALRPLRREATGTACASVLLEAHLLERRRPWVGIDQHQSGLGDARDRCRWARRTGRWDRT